MIALLLSLNVEESVENGTTIDYDFRLAKDISEQ